MALGFTFLKMDLGLMQIAGTALALFGWSRLKRHPRPAAEHAQFFAGVTAVAVFMMLPASAVVWDSLPPLKFVQFPWRFLTLTTIGTAVLCGAAFVAFAPVGAGPSAAADRRRWTIALTLCASFAAAAAVGGTLGVHLRVPADRVGFEEKPYNNMIDRGAQAASSPETMDGSFVKRHTLRWIDHLPTGVGFMGLNQSDLDRPKVEVEEGTARLIDIVSRSWVVAFGVEATTPSRIRVNNYRFPGWTARVDGVVVPIVEAPKQRKVIFLDIPEGRHDVTVAFERTFARWMGDLLSLIGLAALAVVGLWKERRSAES